MNVLVINPGSTSTKIAVYEQENCRWKETIEHPSEELKNYSHVSEQRDYRTKEILRLLKKKQVSLEIFDGIVGRGGMLKPLIGGTYLVDERLAKVLENPPGGEHASNLGGIIAYYLGKEINAPAYIVDPVSVDEFEPVARLSGLPELPRLSQSHALNMKAVARKFARRQGRDYQDLNVIVAHLGGGISVAPHRKGKMIDVNNANNEGPYSVQRCGTLPASQLVELCFSGELTKKEVLNRLLKEGGISAYLKTNDVREVEKRAMMGDSRAKLVLEGLCYQVAKEIGAMAAVLSGEVDRIILTGGLAHSEFIVGEISRRVAFISPISVIPGEEEMEALAFGALRVLTGKEDVLVYEP